METAATEPAGGVIIPAAATTVAAATTTTTTPAAEPAKPQKLEISAEEFTRLYQSDQKLAQFEAAKQAEIGKKEQERLLALAQKDGAEAALRAQKDSSDAREATLTTAFHRSTKLAELAVATGATTFVSPEAARQARELMASKLEVRQSGEDFQVVEKGTGRPVGEAVKAWLASPEFTHFQAATAKGGAGAGNSNLTAVGGNAAAQPTWSDLAIEAQARQNAAPIGNPYDPIRLMASRKN